MQERSKTIGTIPVDAIFSPVTRVNYFVEPTRVGQQTELDRLVLEIWTDGSIGPSVALAQASRIMQDYLALFSSVEGEVEQGPTFAEAGPTSRARDIKIDDLDFSNRTYNCLKRQGIETLEELRNYTEEELMAIRNFGQKSLDEVKVKLEDHDLALRPTPSADTDQLLDLE
jgi:DNA-directed RNA polymerase subunit alpha